MGYHQPLLIPGSPLYNTGNYNYASKKKKKKKTLLAKNTFLINRIKVIRVESNFSKNPNPRGGVRVRD